MASKKNAAALEEGWGRAVVTTTTIFSYYFNKLTPVKASTCKPANSKASDCKPAAGRGRGGRGAVRLVRLSEGWA